MKSKVYYYKKYSSENETYLFASSTVPKVIKGLIEIEEVEYNQLLAEIIEKNYIPTAENINESEEAL